MILTADYHTHTPYSDGNDSVYKNALAAKEKGLQAVGITDHGFSHIFFGLRRKEVAAQKEEIAKAQSEIGIKILHGMESNLLSVNGDTDMLESDMPNFDIYICGIHEAPRYKTFKDQRNLFFKNWFAYKRGRKPSQYVIDYTTKAYINAIKKNPIDILAHINFRCCCNIVEVAKCCADYGTYMEINTKKYHVSADELNAMANTGVRFVIDSDAHTADRVGDTKIAEELLSTGCVPLEQIDNIDGRFPKFRFTEYKQRNL